MNDFHPGNLWQQGDYVSRALLIVLVLMSVLSWTVMLFKGGQLMRLRGLTDNAYRRFWQADSLDEGERKLGRPVGGNPYRALVDAGREAQASRAGDASHLEGALSPDEWLSRSLHVVLDEHLQRLQNGLAVLASIGSTAPFVGLFGTVWGIYHALMAIGASGQASLDKVAGPVGESLVMTAIGLFVAIPAVLGYNAISRGNRRVSQRLHRFTHDLHMYFMSGSRHKPRNGRTAAPPAPQVPSQAQTPSQLHVPSQPQASAQPQVPPQPRLATATAHAGA